jgi:hypothetical protein
LTTTDRHVEHTTEQTPNARKIRQTVFDAHKSLWIQTYAPIRALISAQKKPPDQMTRRLGTARRDERMILSRRCGDCHAGIAMTRTLQLPVCALIFSVTPEAS